MPDSALLDASAFLLGGLVLCSLAGWLLRLMLRPAGRPGVAAGASAGLAGVVAAQDARELEQMFAAALVEEQTRLHEQLSMFGVNCAVRQPAVSAVEIRPLTGDAGVSLADGSRLMCRDTRTEQLAKVDRALQARETVLLTFVQLDPDETVLTFSTPQGLVQVSSKRVVVL